MKTDTAINIHMFSTGGFVATLLQNLRTDSPFWWLAFLAVAIAWNVGMIIRLHESK